MKPLVSIIIPTYNREIELAQTLDSVLAQTFPDWECLVVDDGSTDNTEQMMRDYAHLDNRISYYKRPQDRQKGANACRNFGLQLSRGKYVNWIDSDDVVLTGHLESHLKAHKMHEVDATISKAEVFIGHTGNRVRVWSEIYPQRDLIGEMTATKVLWPIACLLWKKSVVPEKPFMEDLGSSQEWTFHLMQIIRGLKYHILDQTTYLVREHENRIGKSPAVGKFYSMFRSRAYIFELLRAENLLSATYERDLLHYISLSLRLSIKLHYYRNAMLIVRFLVRNFFTLRCKQKVLRILFLAIPIYLVTGKGERLFSIPLSGA